MTDRRAPDGFPPGFFDRADPAPDADFYSWPRLVTHIDDAAIAAVGALYDELRIRGEVLDLMSSWVSHFTEAPEHLTVLGMNAHELAQNRQARAAIVHDLNLTPTLPFADRAFDAAVCCVSVDYLIQPVAVFTDVARVLRPGATLVVYDILQGPGGAVRYPTPWSVDGRASFLLDLAGMKEHLIAAGFELLEHRERREESVAWFETRAAAAAAGALPPLSVRLLLGPVFKDAFANLLTNLKEARVIPTYLRAVRLP